MECGKAVYWFRDLTAKGLSLLEGRSFANQAHLVLALISTDWIKEVIDWLFSGVRFNLLLSSVTPALNLLTAPFSYAHFAQLISNTMVFLPLSDLFLSKGALEHLMVLI